jgi:hypothetical protein
MRLMACCVLAVMCGTAWAQPTPDAMEPCNLPPQPPAAESTWNANLWSGGVVPYEIDGEVTLTNRNRLRAAMDELEQAANIHFIPRTGQPNYIYVQNGGGNNSFVGMVGGSQTINLVSWSSHYVICHELMHALGMWHEQQRADRELYVTINTNNIQQGYAHNFSIRAGSTVVGPFDFESVMLYHPCSFSVCCPAGSVCNCAVSCASIQAKPEYAHLQGVMGNRSYLSDLDKAGLVARYGPQVLPCGTADFDNDGDVGTDADIEAFFVCLSGNCCPTCFERGPDFDGDGDVGTDADIEAFFRVLAGGSC